MYSVGVYVFVCVCSCVTTHVLRSGDKKKSFLSLPMGVLRIEVVRLGGKC